MLDEGAVLAAVDEVLDHLYFMDTVAGVADLGPPCEVVTEWLGWSLYAHGELLEPTRALVRANEVVYKCLLEVQPAVYASGRQAVKPGPGRAEQHEVCIAYCYALVTTGEVDDGGVVAQPILGLCCAIVLGRVVRQG